MIRFEEQTEQEAGFAALWDRHIAPGLDEYSRHYTKAFLLLAVGWTLLVAIFLAVVWIYQKEEASIIFGLNGQNIIAVVAIVGAALGYGAYLPFKKLTKSKQASFKTAIDEHFQDHLTPLDDLERINAAVEDLHSRKILPKNTPSVKAAYQSHDHLFRFYNVIFMPRSSGNQTRQESVPYLVLEMTLERSLSSEIRFLTDDALENFFRRLFKRGSNVRLANNEFEKLFEVFSNDPELVNEIFTPELQQNFVDMQNYFMTSSSRWTGSRRITAGLKGNTFSLAIHGLDDVAGQKLAIKSPKN